jgi:hypothetical protein
VTWNLFSKTDRYSTLIKSSFDVRVILSFIWELKKLTGCEAFTKLLEENSKNEVFVDITEETNGNYRVKKVFITEDFNMETFKCLIAFLYTGRLSLDSRTTELLALAKKLNVFELLSLLKEGKKILDELTYVESKTFSSQQVETVEEHLRIVALFEELYSDGKSRRILT